MIPQYSDEELARGFFVNILRGSKVAEIVEGTQIGAPPFRFYLIASNPGKSPMELAFASTLKTDMRLYSGETEMFRFADTKRARNEPSTDEIPARSRKSFPLAWDGKMSDGSYPPSGIYTIEFILNSNPPYKLMVDNVDFAFPMERVEEDEAMDRDTPPS